MCCHLKEHKGQPALTPGKRGPNKRKSTTRRPAKRGHAPMQTRQRTTSGPQLSALPRNGKSHPVRQHTPESLTPRQRTIVDEAVRTCAEVLTDDWKGTVAEQATNYVAIETWEKLFRRRRQRHCRVLADIAKMILDSKTKLHDLIGTIAAWLTSLIGGGILSNDSRASSLLGSPCPSMPNSWLQLEASRSLESCYASSTTTISANVSAS
jgi:hypothetical protein